MNIYHFHPSTGVFLGQGEADADPLTEGQYLLPAHSTTIAPPSVAIGFFPAFDGVAWQAVAEPEPAPPPPPPSAAEVKVANLRRVDADVDAIYAAAIGNRATEYSEAEAQANAFKSAGYAGTAPAYVASWLANNTKGFSTAQQAADDIIAQANAWRGAAASIRANRLLAKKNITTDVTTAMAQWNGFVTVIRGQLGL